MHTSYTLCDGHPLPHDHMIARIMETANVVLLCLETGESENGSLTFSFPPLVGKDIKMAVEREYDIPAFGQTVSFNSHILQDDAELSYTRVRSGDTFLIHYHSKADCTKIKNLSEWLDQLATCFRSENPTVTNGISQEFKNIVRSEVGKTLQSNLFASHDSPRSCTNRHYFHHHGGTDKLLEVYRSILQNPWSETLYLLKVMEYKILGVIWNLTADSRDNFAMREYLAKVGAVEMFTKSLWRTRISEGEQIGIDMDQRIILIYVLESAIGVLSNMSEAPSCRMLIASNAEVLDQLTCIAVTPTSLDEARPLVANLFINLAYSVETHPHITKPHLVKRLLDTSRICSETDRRGNSNQMALRYFTQLYLALVILPSPHCITSSDSLCDIISANMAEFLKAHPYENVMKWEEHHGFFWSTLLPFVNALYVPNTPVAASGVVRHLQLLSLKTIFFGLEVMLSRENQRTILTKEGLFDYVRCSPAHAHTSLRPQAERIVNIISPSTNNQTQSPPSLLVMTKAHLAKMHFGLERILTLSVGQLVSEVL